MKLSSFVTTYNGHSVDVDKSYGYQCWDLGAAYSQRVVGVPGKYSFGLPTGDGCAAGVYYNFRPPLSKYYKRIKNTATAYPKQGDLIVWSYRLPGSYGCGHIAIVLSVDRSGFTSFDQNWGGKYAHKVRHNWNYVAGWLRPIRATSSPKPAAKKYYIVRSGDTVTRISNNYGIGISKFKSLNPSIKNINLIYVGQKVRVK